MPEFKDLFTEDHIHFMIQQSRFTFAKLILGILIQTYPDDPKNYEFLLIIASLDHNTKEFFDLHKTIRDRFPGTALEYLADGLYPGVKINDARVSLHMAKKLDPQNPFMYYFLSLIYIQSGNYNRGLKYANQCLEIDPRFHIVLLLRRVCFQKIGKMFELTKDSFSAMCYLENVNELHMIETLVDDFNKYKSSDKNLLIPPKGKTS